MSEHQSDNKGGEPSQLKYRGRRASREKSEQRRR